MGSEGARPPTLIDLERIGSKDNGQHGTKTQDHNVPSKNNSTPKRLKKKHELPLKTVPSEEKGGSLHGDMAANLSIIYMSPWSSYNKLYSLQFGTSTHFAVVERKHFQPEQNPLCIVKTFSAANADGLIQSIRRIKHRQFVQATNVFFAQEIFFVTFEFMPVSLAEIAANPLVDDLRLASVIGQVVDGLLYLKENALGHGQLTCSNILVDPSGSVKLWGQEYIQDSFSIRDVTKSLASIIMKLVQGYVKEGGRIGLDIPQRCPLGFDFLSILEQTSSIEELTKQPLLQLPWHKKRLAGLVSLAQIWADRGYRFDAREQEN